tara:strand:- start:3512 stop:4057 length:546 start_codon:yes stop_codon:yes gene_type:complete
MKHLKLNYLLITLLFSAFTLTSCDRDDDNNHRNTSPITLGSSVTVTNTFQSTAFTMDAELPVEDLFMMPSGSLAATANVGSAVEFSAYLLNLYDIDINENTITFDVVAEANDPTYGNLFRVLEPATFDRYYLTFDEAQDVSGFTSSNPSVNLRIDSANIIVVEIGEGYDFNPDQSFTITLN